MTHKPHRLSYYRDLLYEMILRDLKIRYKRSFLGIAWSLITPLLQLIVFGLVFSVFLPLNIPNYPIFLFIGIVVYTWFQQSVIQAANSITDNPTLVRQPSFPVAILPAIVVLSQLVHFFLALLVVFPFMLWFNIPVSSSIIFLPAIIVLQLFFTMGISYFVASWQVTFRDTQYLLGVLLLLGFYLSPVFYELGMIPEEYLFWYQLNPMVYFIESYRNVIIRGVIPDFLPSVWIAIVTLVTLFLGRFVFERARYRFVEEL